MRGMKRLVIIGMVLIIAGALILGCERAIKGTGVYGKVIDKDTKKPIEGLTVRITMLSRLMEGQVTKVSPRRALSVPVTTDSSGKFSFTELEPATYAITVKEVGYFAYSLSDVEVKEGKMKKVNVRLMRIPPFGGGE